MRNSGLCKIACSLAALILVATSASCGTSTNVTNTPNNSSKYRGTVTASQAFNTPSIWYKVYEEDGGMLSENAEIRRVFSIDSKDKVTEYNTGILNACKGNGDLTFASMQDTSPQELVDILKKAEEDLPDLCQTYFKQQYDSELAQLGDCDVNQTGACMMTSEEWYAEHYPQVLNNYKARSKKFSLSVGTDALGKRTTSECLDIIPVSDSTSRTDWYYLRPMTSVTLSSKTYGGYYLDKDGENYLVPFLLRRG